MRSLLFVLPVGLFYGLFGCTRIAQLVEQKTENLLVGGSSPLPGMGLPSSSG